MALGWAKVCVSWEMPVISTVASSWSIATPAPGSSRATISQVAAAVGSTQIAVPKPVFEM